MENLNEISNEIRVLDDEFIELFPDVTIDDIPEEVFVRTENEGLPLTAAYALYVCKLNMIQRKIDKFNKKNGEKSPGMIKHDGVSEKLFTFEQIKRMSAAEVAANYERILKSLENLNKKQ